MKKVVVKENEGELKKFRVTTTDKGIRIDMGMDTPKGRIATEFEFTEDDLLDLMEVIDVLKQGLADLGG